MPRFVVGGTLVSIATTGPELVVSVTASTMRNPGIALGNSVGSCICNIGLIVGMVALLMPVDVDRTDFLKRAAWMVAGGIAVVVVSWDLTISREASLLLLAMAGAYLLWDLVGVLRARAATDDDGEPSAPLGPAVGWFTFGAALILAGSRLLVTSGEGVAAAMGVPSAIIGFSVIAIGTSLPELVTGVTAARRGVPDLSIGNILGANVLNLLLILGISATLVPLTLDPFSQWYAFPWLGIFFLALIGVVLRPGRLSRAAGIGLLLLYALYIVGLVAISLVAI